MDPELGESIFGSGFWFEFEFAFAFAFGGVFGYSFLGFCSMCYVGCV